MLKILLAFILVFNVSESAAKAVKLGDMINQPQVTNKRVRVKGAQPAAEISCLTNEDCPFDRECVALRCMDVCTKDTCITGKECIAVRSKPHQYLCVDCVFDRHCKEGLECSKETFTCVKRDVCAAAVCSPAAPFCVPKPYKTLPYTCVQCLEDEDCPPVAGLARSCVDYFCLFNIEGNIPDRKEKKSKNKKEPLVQTEEDPLFLMETEIEDDVYDD